MGPITTVLDQTMSEKLQQTQAMLAKHHRDGNHFAELMKSTFNDRFDETFWQQWDHWMAPSYSESPRVVDLGCGPGLFVRAVAERTPGLRAIGVECAPYMLESVGELPDGCEVICEDLHDPHLPLDDDSVDAVMASVVLHEMNQPLKTLREIHRCLRPGGRIYIADWVRAPLESYLKAQLDDPESVFGEETPVDELDDLFIHFIEHNRFSREDLIFMLNKSGFALLYSELFKEGRYARLVAEKR